VLAWVRDQGAGRRCVRVRKSGARHGRWPKGLGGGIPGRGSGGTSITLVEGHGFMLFFGGYVKEVAERQTVRALA
jgi:hypothetical protein